ncbi:MAG: amidohydrolase family protein, partial [Phycisphaerae bacterium]|nr:amidohydrolase family protein [Phycisphaerae bacterium]
FDGLKLLCTHMGGWRMWDEVERHILGTGCYLETSFALEELGPQRAVQMMRTHGIERVMFGTDWPWKRQDDEVQRIKHLPITAAEADAILFSNAAKLLGY